MCIKPEIIYQCLEQGQSNCFGKAEHRRPEEVSLKTQAVRRNQLGYNSRKVFQAEEQKMGMLVVCSKEKTRGSMER